jgi:hypothetical protein
MSPLCGQTSKKAAYDAAHSRSVRSTWRREFLLGVVYREVHHNVVVAPASNDAQCSGVSSYIYIGIVTLIKLAKNKYKSFGNKGYHHGYMDQVKDMYSILHCLDNALFSEDLRVRAAMRLNA